MPDAIDVTQRSAQIIHRPDGTFEWAKQIFPDYESALEARWAFRAITFGMIYGGFRNG